MRLSSGADGEERGRSDVSACLLLKDGVRNRLVDRYVGVAKTKNTHLVRRRVLAEPDVAVDPEYDVLERELRDRLVGLGDPLRQGLNERLPILERPPVFGVSHWWVVALC